MSNEMTGLTPSQCFELLCGHFRSGNFEDVIYLEGHHGIGKTEIALQAAVEVYGAAEIKSLDLKRVLQMTEKERGFYFEREYPATKQVEDYTGVPFLKDGRTCWGTPCFFATAGHGVLVIEELNQATEEVLKAFFPLLQDKKIGAHVLSPEVHIVVTGNPPNSIHHVTEFAPALKDRMQRIGFVHSAPDWLKWAKGHAVHPAVTGYIEDNKSMMHIIPDDGSPGPTPRAWTSVSRTVTAYEAGFYQYYMVVEMLKNRVGLKAATEFLGYLKNKFKRAVTAEELFADFAQYGPRYQAQVAAGKAETIDSLARWIDANFDKLTKESVELTVIHELFTKKEMTSNGILVAKCMGINKDAINKLVQLGRQGLEIGQKLASIRHSSEAAK